MRRPSCSAQRPGMTLVELLVAMVIAVLLLQGMVAFFTGQSRVVGQNESMRGARDATRSAIHAFLGDLRRVEATGGVAAASASEVTVRVPFAMGVACQSGSANTTLSVFPTDSIMWATSTLSGFAWRNANTGAYSYVSPAVLGSADADACTGKGVKVFGGGAVRTVTPTAGSNVRLGTPVFLYHLVTYKFETVTGGSRLVRTRAGHDPEVLVELFDPDATRFRFFVGGNATAQDNPPTDLGTLRGLEVVLAGRGDRPRSDGSAFTAPMTLAIFFKNRP
jgi:prepilin-type N-terminal cleavage/methylation domain-containing protein